MEYIKRIIDAQLEEKLQITGAVLIKGCKLCGKTTTAKKYSKSILEMQNPDTQENNINLANTKTSLLLNGVKPRLIDEWQMVPKLWNAVRYSVDLIGLPEQYILTGSATPIDDETLHSGVGRFSIINMKPMTLFESGDSNGKISLKDLFEHNIKIDGIKSDLTFEKLAFLICRGGWPNSVNMAPDKALKIAQNYIELLVSSYITEIDGVKRNPELARTILKSYSRQISTIDSDKSLIDDVKANFTEVSDKTIYEYINHFKLLFIIDEINAWNPNIRSKTVIRTSPKKSFIDPSLAAASLTCTPNDLLMDFNTYGLLFENLVDRDLSVYVSSLGGHLNHYRDNYGLECDSIIRLNNGKYALVEIKLSGNHIEEAEKHLLKLKSLIEEKEPRLGKPELIMIITATDMAYEKESGVLVIPIGCLKD